MLIGGLERLLGVQEREKNEFPEFKDLLKALLAVHVRRLIYFVQVLCVYEAKERTSISCQMHYYHQSLHLTSYKVPKSARHFLFIQNFLMIMTDARKRKMEVPYTYHFLT